MVSAPPRPLYPPGKRPSTYCTGGLVGPRAGLNGCENLAFTGIRFSDRPARSESLYRLRCRGPHKTLQHLTSKRCANFIKHGPTFTVLPFHGHVGTHPPYYVVSYSVRPRYESSLPLNRKSLAVFWSENLKVR